MSTETISWNPAFRPDSHRELDSLGQHDQVGEAVTDVTAHASGKLTIDEDESGREYKADRSSEHTEVADMVEDATAHTPAANKASLAELGDSWAQVKHEDMAAASVHSRHFAQSASIHHLPESEEAEHFTQDTEQSFENLPRHGTEYNSDFPTAPQRPSPGIPEHVDPLPRSQAEEIVAVEKENTEAWGNSEQSAQQSSSEINWGKEDADDDFLAGANGGHDNMALTEEDSRFEEGLPLVQHAEKPTDAIATQIDWANAGADEDIFGSGVKATASPDSFQIPQLDRKSTADVLDSMHYPPHSETHDEIASPEPSTTDELTGGGIAVSSATAAQAILAEPRNSQLPEADLAAIWSEALGDDDLLVEDAAVDPSAFFGNDDEGFLDDSADSALSPPVPTLVHDQKGQMQGFDTTGGPQKYSPAQAASTYQPDAYRSGYGSVAPSILGYGAPPPRPEVPKAQSFVDKTKGGYESPYDLPLDLRPKRQPAPRRPSVPTTTQATPAPPRTSSYSAAQLSQFPLSEGPPTGPPAAGAGPRATPSAPPKANAFFEELPIVAKPPRPSSAARFTPSIQQSGPSQPAHVPLSRPLAPNNPSPDVFNHGLVMPSRELAIGREPVQALPTAQTPPKASNRYSPAPAAQPGHAALPPAQGRYSNAPPTAPPPNPARAASVGFIPPFQPRTSSPLARSTSISEQPAYMTTVDAPMVANGYARGPQMGSLQNQPRPLPATPEMSPTNHAFYQSPEEMPHRPSSEGVVPRQASPPMPISQQTGTVRRRRMPSLIKQYIPPADNRAQDPLERWKGGPIFRFSSGGVVSSFPVETPRYSVGQSQPLYIVNPGQVKVRSAKLIAPLDDSIATFPGPLKNKGRKKELLGWLNKHIEVLKARYVEPGPGQDPELLGKRHDERVLLFQILTILVEQDGSLEIAPAAVSAVRDALVPPSPLTDPQLGAASWDSGFAQGITSSSTAQLASRSIDVEALEEIRKLLLKGEREKAVWHAVDKNLWSHAMVIASTVQGDIWKNLVHEFVRNEVKNCGNNTEALSALFDVFAGNWEESVDQLVPSSARSGLQMLSRTGSTSNQNALSGLDRWQETVALIISNRSTGDAKALVSLGELLSGYGRAEAAHICYILAHLPGLLSGADDPTAHVVLLGANHRQQYFDFSKDTEAILATEIYEFAVNVLAGGTFQQPMPYLAAYKLQHAYVLAEAGRRDEAQQYCEVIAAALKARKLMPYLHAQLISELDELTSRLSQAPREPSKSWLGNPKMGDVSNSLLNRLNKFVAGDDSDGASAGSATPAEQGPFGGISGEPISLSRTGSPAMPGPTFGMQNGHTPNMPVPGAGGRYAPSGSYSTSSATSFAGPQHRESAGSLPRMSPDHFKKIPPRGAYTPTSGLATSSHSPEMPRSVPAASGINHDSLAVEDGSRPSTREGPPGMSARRPSHEPLRPNAAFRDRNAITYQPRSTGFESRSSSFAPRASSYVPRSYAPSPAGSERLPQQASPDLGYVPSAPAPEPPSLDAPGTSLRPANQLEPAEDSFDKEEVQPAAEAPISFGYDTTPLHEDLSPQPTTEGPAAESPQPSYGYQPSEAAEPDAEAGETGASSSSYAPPSSTLEPPSSSYEPVASVYQPYEPDTNGDEPDSPVKTRKRGGIMDLDDDDFAATAERLKREEKARKDREADEAFRRAAEADAARDSQKTVEKRSSGWFSGVGGLFTGGAKKDKGISSGAGGGRSEPTVHRAKLGEESSFVYDENLKKWVNKKAGAEAATAKTATPPPPKGGPPSRAASAMGGPPKAGPPTSLPSSAPPSRNISPLLHMKAADNSTAEGEPMDKPSAPPLPPMGGGLVAPSRPGTGMSGASSTSTTMDDLLAVGPRKASAKKAAKKGGGRYVDVMGMTK